MATALAYVAAADAALARLRIVFGDPPDLGGGACKVHQVGTLRAQAARPDLGLDLPALIVQPEGLANIQPRDVGAIVFDGDSRVRILYLRKFEPGGGVERAFWLELEKLAQTFLDDVTMGELTVLPAGTQIVLALAETVEFRPPELQALAEAGRADILGGSVTLNVRLWTQRL